MIRLLLASTAIAALLTSTTLAQDASSSASMTSASMDSSMTSSMPMDSSMMASSAMSSQMTDASSMDSSMMSSAPASDMMSSSAATDMTSSTASRAPVQLLSGYTVVDSDRLATKIIGQPVYDGTATNANNLGKINDLVFDANGQIVAVVIGVGGFLGLGEKQVAVDLQALQFSVAADNTKRYVLQATKDQLTSAPDFKSVDTQPGSSAPADSSTASGLDTTASSGVMALSSASGVVSSSSSAAQ